MTTTPIFLVWKNEKIRSIFTSHASAEAFIKTHFDGQDGVWVSQHNLHDVTPEELPAPQAVYVIRYADQEFREFAAALFGKDNVIPPELEKATLIAVSNLDDNTHGLTADDLALLASGTTIVKEGFSGGFSVFSTSKETAEDVYMNRLAESACLSEVTSD